MDHDRFGCIAPIQEDQTVKKGAVVIFARRPELRKVKTRLHSRIGESLALSLYRAFLADTLVAARQSGARVILAHTAGPAFPEQALADITICQQGGNFGERFDFSLAEAKKLLPAGTPLVLIGADTPQLSPNFLNKATATLRIHDAVIGPNDNGGFYLLGFSKQPIPVAAVFAHTAEEEPRELDRLLREVGFRTAFLEQQFDIDQPEDLTRLARLISHLERTHSDWIPRNTRNLMRSQRLISPTATPTLLLG